MTKKERVISAIKMKEVDHVPSCFSLHFDEHEAYGEKGVRSHIDFFKKTDTDILKIMNENLVPNMGEIKVPSDWGKFNSISLNDDFIQNQLDFTKRILDKTENVEEIFTVGTMHGIVTSAIHPIEKKYGYEKSRKILCKHLREGKDYLLDVFKKIEEGMNLLSEAYLSLGLDGVYYASLGGEKYYFDDKEFKNYVAPFEKNILKNIKNNNGYTILHICKDDLNIKRYSSFVEYSDIINWGVYEGGVSLEKGKKIFGDVAIMGGLKNRSGVLVEGSEKDIKKEVKNIINSFGEKGFILGADCTLPTDISYEKIASAVKATL